MFCINIVIISFELNYKYCIDFRLKIEATQFEKSKLVDNIIYKINIIFDRIVFGGVKSLYPKRTSAVILLRDKNVK